MFRLTWYRVLFIVSATLTTITVAVPEIFIRFNLGYGWLIALCNIQIFSAAIIAYNEIIRALVTRTFIMEGNRNWHSIKVAKGWNYPITLECLFKMNSTVYIVPDPTMYHINVFDSINQQWVELYVDNKNVWDIYVVHDQYIGNVRRAVPLRDVISNWL